MGYVRRSSASAIGAVVALLVAVSSAAAVEPTEFRLEQDQVPVEPMLASQLQSHIDRVAAASDPATVEPMRNPWLE